MYIHNNDWNRNPVIQRAKISDLRDNYTLGTGPRKPILQHSHRFDYFTFGSKNGARVTGLVHYTPDGVDAFVVNSDSVIPCKGREVYFVPVSYGAYNTDDVIETGAQANELEFVFYSADQMGLYRGEPLQPHERVGRFAADTSLVIAGGTTVTLLDSDDFRHLAGLPLYLKVSMRGGGVQALADSPLELRFREFGPNSAISHHRTYLFPGDGKADIVIPVAQNWIASATDGNASRWRLEAHKMTGSTTIVGAASYYTNPSVVGELCVGVVPETIRYNISMRKQPTTPSTNVCASFCWTASPTVASLFYRNDAAAGAASIFHRNFVPSLDGGANGAYAIASSTAIAAGTQAYTTITGGSRHGFSCWSWDSAPTTPVVVITSPGFIE